MPRLESTVQGATSLLQSGREGGRGKARRPYAISDGQGGVSSATVNVDVAPDGGPTARPDTASTAAGQPVIVPVLANDTDPDGDPLSVTGASAPHGAVTLNPDGTITYTPDAGFTAFHAFAVDNGLLRDLPEDGVAGLAKRRAATRSIWWRWLLEPYLFVRIPPVRPAAATTAGGPLRPRQALVVLHLMAEQTRAADFLRPVVGRVRLPARGESLAARVRRAVLKTLVREGSLQG